MKVVQINVTCGHGSTGVIAIEIAELLKSNGTLTKLWLGRDEKE